MPSTASCSCAAAMLESDPSFLRRFGAIASALPALVASPLVQLGAALVEEVGPARALGTWGAIVAPLLVLAFVLALATRRVRLTEALTRDLNIALFGAVGINLVDLGLWAFYADPHAAPGLVRACALLVCALVLSLYAHQGGAGQRPARRLIAGLGLTAFVLPFLGVPLVAYAAGADQVCLLTAPTASGRVLPTAPRRVVLVVVDALRRRSTGLDPAHPAATPHLKALAAVSTDYTRAVAPVDATLLSMPVMLTGSDLGVVYPRATRGLGGWPHAAKPGFYREGELVGFAGHLRAGGYRTYYANMLVTPSIFGMDAEYDAGYATADEFDAANSELDGSSFLPVGSAYHWLGSQVFGLGDPVEPSGPDGLDRTLAAAAAFYLQPDARAFVRVHLGMPHEPLYPIDKDPRTGHLSIRPGRTVEFNDVWSASRRLQQDYEADYEANVAYMDQELGVFLATLSASPLWEDTLLIVTADHGTDFQPNRPPHCAGTVTEALTHVPLLIHRPHQHEGARDARLVTSTDLLPTTLGRVYARPPALAGADLAEPADPARIVGSWGIENPYDKDHAHLVAVAAYQGPYKLVMRRGETRSTLYDLAADPGLRQDLAARHPEIADRLGAWAARALLQIAP